MNSDALALDNPDSSPATFEHLTPTRSRDALLFMTPRLDQEWILGNGIGTYASMSATMCPTRRQHGLLIVPEIGQTEPTLLLARVEESIELAHGETYLSGIDYSGAPAPEQHPALRSLRLEPRLRFGYTWDGLDLERELGVDARPSVQLRYALRGNHHVPGLWFTLRPFFAYRSIHALQREQSDWNRDAVQCVDGVEFHPVSQRPVLRCQIFGTQWSYIPDAHWYHDIRFRRDEERGYFGTESQFSPGIFRIYLCPGDILTVDWTAHENIQTQPLVSSSGPHFRPRSITLKNLSASDRDEILQGRSDFRQALHVAAEHYFYRDAHGRTGIIAGFPWFREWGRDTMISLPGLTLARGQVDRCRSILEGCIRYLKNGRLPNIFGETPEDSRYNSIDASLLFARAIDLYDAQLGRSVNVAYQFVEILESIASAYEQGFDDLSVTCNTDGLLYLHDPSLNLTWMDAMIDGKPVTPRTGAPIEINALWYALLHQLAELHERCGHTHQAAAWHSKYTHCGESMVQRFWSPELQILADRCAPMESSPPTSSGRDLSIRPNMILATALARSPFSDAIRRTCLERCDLELRTPRGLRTLSPRHADFVPRYMGEPAARDYAYHQGTVWPWLLGAWAETTCRVWANDEAKERLQTQIAAMEDHLMEAGLGQVSEIFDAQAPHIARGTIAQAWSVAELLRMLQMAEDPTCVS